MKLFLLFFLFSIAFIWLVRSQKVKPPVFPNSEYVALHDLYNSTNGTSWRWFNTSDSSRPWNFSNPKANPCVDNWQGIVCSYTVRKCSVSVLILEGHNLVGRLPDSIGQLQNVTILNLKRNHLSNTIPEGISNLKSLIVLDLSINALTGPIPSTINNLQQTLQIIELRTNSLNYIPESFWNLTNLELLSLGDNSFHQSLSCSINQLKQLKSLNLELNRFNATLPNCFDNLQLLDNFQISNNEFTGKLPSSLFTLTNLTSFAVGSNYFSGTIPFGLSQLVNLRSLFLNNNQFFGNLSSCFFCNYNNSMKLFSLGENYLTGTIPFQLSETFHQTLNFLYLEHNSFHGKLEFLNDFNFLLTIQLNDNFFSGSMNNTLLDASELKLLNCAVNQLTGGLPYSPNWKLVTYQMNNNYLSSTLSDEFHSFPNLLYLLLQNNYIISTIPAGFMENTTKLEYLNLGNNLLTGSIPPSLTTNVPKINQLLLFENMLTSTIPIELMNNRRLVVLSLYANRFIGTFPNEIIMNLQLLQELLVQNNQLTGSIDNVLNITKNSRMTSIDVSNNLFTGTIPEDIFYQPNLQSFVISSNCLHGPIPLSVCSSRILQSYSMDGYSTAVNCRVPIFKDFLSYYFNGFTISNYLHGGIPTCLFELSTMQSLHLSGLGVDGNLPDNIVLSGNLSDLSLSHNVLTGTIPLIFQEKSWISLDLSYNKLTGTLSSMFNSSLNEKQSFRVEYKGILRLLSLQVNRLSGTIPSSLLTLQNISVLTGNLFECNLMNTNLPKSDSGADTYSCGSNSVDYVLYSWLVVIVVVPLLAVLVVRYFLGKEATVNEEEKGKKEETAESHQWTPGICNGMIETVRSSYFQILTWRTFLREHENHSLRRLSMYHQEIRSVTFYMMLYCMLLLLPIYCILKVNYSSYTNEYAWTISAMLLSGLNPGIVLFFLLLIFVIMTVLLIKTLVYRVRELCVNDRSGQKMPSNTTIRESLLNSSRQLSKAFFEDSVRQHSQASLSSSIESGNPQKSMISSVSESRLVIAIVYFSVFIINIIAMSIVDFSYVYIVITYDATIVSITAFLLALFRISTNNILLSKALPWMTMFYSNLKYLNISQASIELLRNNQYSSKDISFLEILILFNNILIPILAIMFILPDCFYNALFSPDSIQTSYTIETCNGYETGDLGVTNPLYFCSPILQEVSYVPPFIYSYQCSSKIIINYVPVYIVMFIFVGCITPFFHLLCRIWYINMIQPKERREEKLSFYEAVIMKWMIPKNLVELEVLRNHRSLVTPDNTISSSKDTADHIPIQFKLFSKLKLTVNMNSYLAIILSFGTLFPPLAFIGYIAICIISVYEESNIARVLIESIRCGNDSYVEMIGKEFYYIEESINLTLWSTLFVCCGLYAYIIFDTTGDTVGWLASLPLALVMFLLPFILWLVKKIVKRWYRSQDEQEESKSDNEGCEAPSALEDNSPEDGFDVLRSISDIQMIARPSQLIRNNTVENPMIKESSKDPSNQI